MNDAPRPGPDLEVITLRGRCVVPGVAGASVIRQTFKDTDRTVVGEFRSGPLAERVVGRTWPLVDKHISVLELHY